MTTTPDTTRALRRAGTFVDGRVTDLQNRLLSPTYRDPSAVAALARLRRGVGKEPGEVLELLEFTVSDELAPGPDGTVGRAERAAHIALTLYAVHQQSRGERMHRRGRGVGAALRALHRGASGDLPDPLVRRFRMLGTADSLPELTHHLRGAVQLLRAGGEPLDYGLLADQLVTWQSGDHASVQLAWGRQFHRAKRADTDPADTTNPLPERTS